MVTNFNRKKDKIDQIFKEIKIFQKFQEQYIHLLLYCEYK